MENFKKGKIEFMGVDFITKDGSHSFIKPNEKFKKEFEEDINNLERFKDTSEDNYKLKQCNHCHTPTPFYQLKLQLGREVCGDCIDRCSNCDKKTELKYLDVTNEHLCKGCFASTLVELKFEKDYILPEGYFEDKNSKFFTKQYDKNNVEI